MKKPRCVEFPSLTDLNITDTNWQVTDTSNGTFYLYNAYYDTREPINHIRILSLINRLEPAVKMYCQLWYENTSDAVVSEVINYEILWPSVFSQNKKGASPFLISCKNPFAIPPKYVSLTERKCEKVINLMEIRNKRSADDRKKPFLVSVKGIDFEDDVSLQLIEWCEILKILGVDNVDIFVVYAHMNVIRVLQFYQQEGFVTIKFLKYPHNLPNKRKDSWHQWTQNDLIPYHDSFYENLYLYEFMIPMDIDEFIMPIRPEDKTWKDLLIRTFERSKIANMEFDSFTVVNRYFLLKSVHENETIKGIPKRLRFLSNIYRAANFTPKGGNAKSFMRMDRVRTVHNHFPQKCLGIDHCRKFTVNLEDGQLSHYRTDCDNPECLESKRNPTEDVTLWKFKNEILKAVSDTIVKLKSFTSNLKGDEIKL